MSCAFLSSEDLTRAKQEGCLWVVSKAQAFIRREQAKKSATTIDSEQVLHDVETRFVALKDEHAAAQKRLDTLVESNAQLQKKAEAAEKALRAMQVRQPCARARVHDGWYRVYERELGMPGRRAPHLDGAWRALYTAPGRSIRAPTGVTFPCKKRRHSSDSPPPRIPHASLSIPARRHRAPDPLRTVQISPSPAELSSFACVRRPSPPCSISVSGQLVEERGRQSWPRKAPRRGRGCKSELRFVSSPLSALLFLLTPCVVSTLHGVRLHPRTRQPPLESAA